MSNLAEFEEPYRSSGMNVQLRSCSARPILIAFSCCKRLLFTMQTSAEDTKTAVIAHMLREAALHVARDHRHDHALIANAGWFRMLRP